MVERALTEGAADRIDSVNAMAETLIPFAASRRLGGRSSTADFAGVRALRTDERAPAP